MRDPAELYELRSDLPELNDTVMLVSLDGFVDAGSTARQVVAHLFDTYEHRELATFDIDRLLDYRSRRPAMTFVEREWTNYTEPSLALHLLRDAAGTPFLLLTGLEPDREWEAFAAAVLQLVDRFSVGFTVGFTGIPMAVPHTRPALVTTHAANHQGMAGNAPSLGRLQVPGSAAGLLEYRFGEAGHDFLGVVVHVPSYLAQSDYPRAAITALEYVSRSCDLALPADGLQEDAERVDRDIEEQVDASEEVQQVVRNLEEQYDSFLESRRAFTDDLDTDGFLAGEDGALPTGEELGAALERFLAEQERGPES